METTKKCNICNQIQPITNFYKSAAKCKPCNIEYAKQYRLDNIDKVRVYDRNRPNHKDRAEAHKERIANISEDKKKIYTKQKNDWRKRNRDKQSAHNKAKRANLDKLQHCEHCKENKDLQGHHPDYTKPLEVVWLCASCHGVEHKRLNAIKRGVAS